MYYRIVITCGVSMFAPTNVFRQWAKDQGLLLFSSANSEQEPLNATDDEERLGKLEQALAHSTSLTQVINDPTRVSAEYSALHALRKGKQLSDNPQILLIHTETLEGKAAAVILAKVLRLQFNATVECVECAMNVNDRQQLRYNLGDFMQKVASALKGHEKHTTCFAPLGGYKVMTSLGYLAGAYFGFPTLYAHEDKQVFHEIPAIPVRVPPDDLQRLAPLIKKVGNGVEKRCLNTGEQSLLEEHSWLFELADEIVAVNAFGLFLMQENPALFGTKLIVARDVDREYGNDGRKAFILQQLGVLSAKLAAGSKEADLQHERGWKVTENDGWHLYKGASNSQQVMRAIYRYDRDQDTLVVRRVWTSHDYVEDFKANWTHPLGETVEWSLS